MAALFARFRAIYLQKWDDQFSSEAMMERAMEEWGVGLAGLSAEQIKRGIDAARVGSKWPPSIAEFVELAKGDVCLPGAAYRMFVSLPKPKPSPDVGRAAFLAIRSVLGGGAVNV